MILAVHNANFCCNCGNTGDTWNCRTCTNQRNLQLYFTVFGFLSVAMMYYEYYGAFLSCCISFRYWWRRIQFQSKKRWRATPGSILKVELAQQQNKIWYGCWDLFKIWRVRVECALYMLKRACDSYCGNIFMDIHRLSISLGIWGVCETYSRQSVEPDSHSQAKCG